MQQSPSRTMLAVRLPRIHWNGAEPCRLQRSLREVSTFVSARTGSGATKASAVLMTERGLQVRAMLRQCCDR